MVTDTTIKQEYKQTEVGVIPEDWEVKNLGDLISSLESGVSVNSVDKEKNIFNHDASILKTSCVIGGKFISEERKIIVSWDLHRAKLNPRKDSIVISRMNTPALVGECGYIDQDYPNLFLPDRLWMTLHKTQVPHSVLWLAYLLSSTIFSRVIKASAAGTSGSMKNISKPSLLAVQILFPPTKAEQEAIAGALSDADALLESLEQLITKKRQIKQGAMQELLTGKKRLPGFSEEWEVKRLPEVVWFQEGPGVRNTQFTNSGVKLLNGTNIDYGKLLLEKTDRYISEKQAFGWYSHFLVDDGDILIACSGVTINKFHEKVTIASQMHLPLCMNTSTMRFKIISNVISKMYFYYFLKSKSFKDQIGGKATGSAQLNFGPSHVKTVEIYMPKPTEQSAITTVLSDMDAEIDKLEQKRDKYIMLKQGMMQQLLTGKIRIYDTN